MLSGVTLQAPGLRPAGGLCEMASVLPPEGGGIWGLSLPLPFQLGESCSLGGRRGGHYSPGTSSLPMYRPRGLCVQREPSESCRCLQLKSVQLAGSETMKVRKCTDSVCYTTHQWSQAGDHFSGFPGCTPLPPPRRSVRSTTSGHLQGRPAPGVPVLEGMWQASTQGSESRRKGEGAVRLDPGSQSLSREGRVE